MLQNYRLGHESINLLYYLLSVIIGMRKLVTYAIYCNFAGNKRNKSQLFWGGLFLDMVRSLTSVSCLLTWTCLVAMLNFFVVCASMRFWKIWSLVCCIFSGIGSVLITNFVYRCVERILSKFMIILGSWFIYNFRFEISWCLFMISLKASVIFITIIIQSCTWSLNNIEMSYKIHSCLLCTSTIIDSSATWVRVMGIKLSSFFGKPWYNYTEMS